MGRMAWQSSRSGLDDVDRRFGLHAANLDVSLLSSGSSLRSLEMVNRVCKLYIWFWPFKLPLRLSRHHTLSISLLASAALLGII